MTNLVFLFLSVFTFSLAKAGYWHNNWDGILEFHCPIRDNKHGAIKRMESYHSNHHEDRRWHFECSYDVQSAGHCGWSGWINGWDAELHYRCPNNGYIAGFYSQHDNHREDRLWNVLCCVAKQGLEDCKWTEYINGWDAHMNYNVPATRIINGLYSRHDNHREDRIWKAYECRLKNCEITHIKITGKPQAYFKGVKVLGVKTGLNCGSESKKLPTLHKVQYNRETTISKMDSFEFGFASQVEVTAGIKDIGSVSSTVGYHWKLGYSMTKTESETASLSTSNGNTISVPAYSAVLGVAVAKEYEFIGQRVAAEYTVNCSGVSQKKYGTVDILSHTFLDVSSATLEEIKVEPKKCGATQFQCINSIDTSSIISEVSSVESRFKACFYTGECPNGYKYFAHDNSCYKLFGTPKHWNAARSICQSEKAELASVTDKQTNDFLNSLTSRYAWIGGMTSKAGSNNWKWSDGRSWGYTNWAARQPNNIGGNQEYVAIRGDGFWDDIDGRPGVSAYQPFICRLQL